MKLTTVDEYPIPVIPPDERILSIHHGDYDDLQTSMMGHERMRAGAARYGYSWCAVNLKQDLFEELVDARNYLILMQLRLNSLGIEIDPVLATDLVDFDEALTYMITALEEDFPDFDGPSSAKWIEGSRA